MTIYTSLSLLLVDFGMTISPGVFLLLWVGVELDEIELDELELDEGGEGFVSSEKVN